MSNISNPKLALEFDSPQSTNYKFNSNGDLQLRFHMFAISTFDINIFVLGDLIDSLILAPNNNCNATPLTKWDYNDVETVYFLSDSLTVGKIENQSQPNFEYQDSISLTSVGDSVSNLPVGGVVNFSYCNGLSPFPFTLYLDNSTLTGINQIAVANNGAFINSTVTVETDYTKIEFTANDCSNFYVQDANDPPTQDNPLAVSISNFEGNFEKDKIILNWQTESEIENQGFILQRKEKNDSLWLEIANYKTHSELKGKGNSSTEQLYTCTDKDFELNKIYSHRIFDVDFDSKESLFEEIVTVSTESQFSNNQHFRLSQNYPNPFNPTTSINYELEITNYENAKLVIFDVLGNRVREFSLKETQGTVVWNGKNNLGKSVSSGIYFYKLETDNFSETKKMLLLK